MKSEAPSACDNQTVNVTRIAILICFAFLIGVPLMFRPRDSIESGDRRSSDALKLIILSPHNEQIRYEFGRAFDHWHQRRFGRRALVIWNVPGGTSEIRKMLESQFTAALESGRTPGGDADLIFGGGSFEFGRLKQGVRVTANGVQTDESILAPVDFTSDWLQRTYGENRLGDGQLYDHDKHWFGVALSGFGIVYNRDALQQLHINEPQAWRDLCNPALQGNVALVNPAQSGSITTAFETILKRHGWQDGWRILRRAGANARYFSASSLKPPIDVTQGNAAVAICIDFYGRYQSQALAEAGDGDRIGYIDPRGGSTIDSDPIAVLRNAPHPELARRFIEFCLSEQGQALWQFPRHGQSLGDDLGPEQFELRRLPIVRAMYDQHFDRFIDRVNPFELASPVEHPNPNYRDFIAPLFAAMAMDNHDELKRAWRAIVSHPAYRDAGEVVTAADVSDPTLKQMLESFDAMPTVEAPNNDRLSLTDESSLADVRAGWLKGKWADQNLWPRQATPADEMRRRFAQFFRQQYRQIEKLAKGTGT
jgi:iron(III) transport system substrate-binding protein